MPVCEQSGTADSYTAVDWPAIRDPTHRSCGFNLYWEQATNTLTVVWFAYHNELCVQARPRLICSLAKPVGDSQDRASPDVSFDLRRILGLYRACEDGHGQLLLRFGHRNATAAAGFVRSLGLEDAELEAIVAFPKREHIGMLRSAIELGSSFCRRLVAQPAIAFLIANYEEFVTSAGISQRHLCSMNTRDLAHALGFELPSTIIQKLPPLLCSTKNLKTLQRLKDKRIRRMLCHLPKLSASVIDLLAVCTHDVAPWIGYGLLEDVSVKRKPDDEAISVKQLLLSVAALAQRLSISPFQIKSLDSLVGVEERLFTEAERKTVHACLEFPPCPLTFSTTNTECHLIPVRTPQELDVLAREYKNCVFAYAWEIATGRVLIYTGETLDGERVMLRVYRSHGSWCPAEVLGVGNEEVTDDLRKVIYRLVAVEQGLRADVFDKRV